MLLKKNLQNNLKIYKKINLKLKKYSLFKNIVVL